MIRFPTAALAGLLAGAAALAGPAPARAEDHDTVYGYEVTTQDGENTTLVDRLEAMDYKNPPYSERYPELLSLYEDDPAVAKYNEILTNIMVGEGKDIHLQNGLDDTLVEIENNWTEGDPGFVNAEEMNFNLKEDSPVFEMGFEPLPFDRIGPRD